MITNIAIRYRIKIYFILLLLIIFSLILTEKLQSCATNGELEVKNYTTHPIIVQIYPISVVFNKRNTNNLLYSYPLKYRLPKWLYAK